MRSLIITLTLVIALMPISTQPQVSANKKPCKLCEELKKLQLPDLTIIKVESKQKTRSKAGNLDPSSLYKCAFLPFGRSYKQGN